MPPLFVKSFIALAAFVVLFIGAPAFAQSQSSSSGDPFSGVPAVDSDQMSAVSGEFAGGVGTGSSTRIGTSGCGALCEGGAQSGAVGTTTRDVSASGNTVSVNVTAINIQTSIVGPGVINTSGGINSATGGGAN